MVDNYYDNNELPKYLILSGEGENGIWAIYDGPNGPRQIRRVLRDERAGGDRWARIYRRPADPVDGPELYEYRDVETGEQRHVQEQVIDDLLNWS